MSKRSNFCEQVWTPLYVRLETEKFVMYIFTDTIFKPNGLNIWGVMSIYEWQVGKHWNSGAGTHKWKLCQVAENFAALFLHCLPFNRLLKSREKIRQPYLHFLKLSRDETLVSRDESLVSRDKSLVSRYETFVSRDESLISREGGNLLLSSTVHGALKHVSYL